MIGSVARVLRVAGSCPGAVPGLAPVFPTSPRIAAWSIPSVLRIPWVVIMDENLDDGVCGRGLRRRGSECQDTFGPPLLLHVEATLGAETKHLDANRRARVSFPRGRGGCG